MVTTLEQIREGAVPAPLAGVYRDIHRTLRVPHVPLLFRAIAPYHGALKSLWKILRPNVATRAFEEAADDLRAHIATCAVDLGTPLIEPVLASVGLDVDELDDVRGQVGLFHYIDPKLMLVAATLHRLLDGHKVGGMHLRPELLRELPFDLPIDAPELQLIPEEPGGVTGEVFHEILRTTHMPIATSDLRALGHWPDFLEVAWREVAPVFQHKQLEQRLSRLRDEAERSSKRLPYEMQLGDALGDNAQTVAHVRRLVEIFFDALPRLTLFASALKVALDGAQEALDSPYPIDWEDDETMDALDLQ